ncbi:phosphate signaling complex protein PhoU [Lachnospiraceae bacterium 62-35]
MRARFDEQLGVLNKELITMGALCENAIANSAKALVDGNIHMAESVPELAVRIDQKEREIEALCLKLLLQQQPVASDLRVISSALKMITDMERIGKQSAEIAEIVTLANIKHTDDTDDIHDMAVAAIKMVTDSIDAFVKEEAAAARAVIDYDDVVDGFFDKIKRMIIVHFSRPDSDSEYAIDLLMIAKYLERIGDHAVNIANWVLFSITGNKEG